MTIDHHPPASIREARVEDRDAIVAITRAAYAEYARAMEPFAWAALSAAIERSLADDHGVTRLVAERDGDIIGSAALYEPDVAAYGDLAYVTPWPEVRLVAVAPSARGRGVARLLVEECISRAKRAGVRAIGLHTSRSMGAAIGLYERMGFVRDPEHDFHVPGAELVEGYLLRLHDAPSLPES